MEGKDEEDRLINVYCVAPNEEESTHPWRQRLCGHWREEIRKGSRWVYTPNNFVIDYWQKNIPVCNVYFIFLFFMLILGKIQDGKIKTNREIVFFFLLLSCPHPFVWNWTVRRDYRKADRSTEANGQTRHSLILMDDFNYDPFLFLSFSPNIFKNWI